jgi:hypothetical protein
VLVKRAERPAFSVPPAHSRDRRPSPHDDCMHRCLLPFLRTRVFRSNAPARGSACLAGYQAEAGQKPARRCLTRRHNHRVGGGAASNSEAPPRQLLSGYPRAEVNQHVSARDRRRWG